MKIKGVSKGDYFNYKIESVSKKHKVSMQTVVREVLESCIDDVNFS